MCKSTARAPSKQILLASFFEICGVAIEPYPLVMQISINPLAPPFVPGQLPSSSTHTFRKHGHRKHRTKPIRGKNHWTSIPDEIVEHISLELPLEDLIPLAQTNSALRKVVSGLTMNDLLNNHNWNYSTRYCRYNEMLPASKLRLGLLAAERWSKFDVRIFEVARWKDKVMPVLRCDTEKMVLGVGEYLHFNILNNRGKWQVGKVGTHGVGDISCLALTPRKDEIIASFFDGRIERYRLPMSPSPESEADSGPDHSISLHQSGIADRYHCGKAPSKRQEGKMERMIISDIGTGIEAIDTWCENILSIDTTGLIVLNNASISIKRKPWTTKFISDSVIATGAYSSKPLVLHAVTPSGLVPMGSSYLSRQNETLVGATGGKSSIYAIEPIDAHTFLTGTYTGSVYLHDLRCMSDSGKRSSHGDDFSGSLEWIDPWDDTAVFSLSLSRNMLCAGMATNGAIKIFDLRCPFLANQSRSQATSIVTTTTEDPTTAVRRSERAKSIYRGQTYFLGKRVHSPVYSVVAEHEVVYGALEDRLHSLDTRKRDAGGVKGGQVVWGYHHIDHKVFGSL